MFRSTFVALLVGLSMAVHVSAHGRLWDPPMRSTIWRFPEFQHLNLEKNWSDMELYCGGKGIQYDQNGGKCGPCGDRWDAPRPRENESGGKYGKGIIGRRYKKGQTIKADIDLTAAHAGYFEFKLCPNGRRGVPEEQPCFDKYTLKLASGGTRYPVGYNAGHHYVSLVLPPDVSCQNCVLQWRYVTGNSWGDCGNGQQGMGCGPQEQFVNCADISIV